MTKEQLNLLLEYVNIKARVAFKEAKGQGISPSDFTRLLEIVGELEETCEEKL